KLFPHRFSLKNYFYWPDSAHVAQALKYAKEKNYVKETAEGYVLRPAGRKLARQAAKAMKIPFPMPPKVEKQTVDSRPETVAKKPVKPAPVPKKKKQEKKVEKKAVKKAGVKKTKPV